MENKYKDKLQAAEGLTKVEILNEIALDIINDSPEESKHYNKQALNLIEQLGDKPNSCNQDDDDLLNLKAKTLFVKGKIFHKSLDLDKSKQTFRSILNLDQKKIIKKTILDIYYNLSKVYEDDNDFQTALDYFEKYVKLKDDMHQIEKDRLITIIESEYELEKKQKQAEIFKLRNIELFKTNQKLMEALEEINTLNKLLPICASCKKIRNDKGYWEMIENYIENHSEAQLFNSLCPDCANKIT